MRVPNWDVLLFRWSVSVVGQPYEWGRTDCASLVRQAMTIVYGSDPFDVRPWSTKRQALTRLKAVGSVEDALRAAGMVPVALRHAQGGDVLCEAVSDGYGACGVVVGRVVVWATQEDGVVRVPLRGREGTLLRFADG